MPDEINSALLLLRLMMGGVFLVHGIKHAMGREKTTRWFGSLGFKAPGLQWFLSTATEISAGALVILGFMTGPAVLAITGTMVVAYWVNHRAAGFFITAFMKEGIDVEGYEYVLALTVAGAVLAVAGPGEFAIDWVVERNGVPIASLLDGWVGALIIVAGIAAAAGQMASFWRPNDA